MRIESQVSGIPCLVEVESFHRDPPERGVNGNLVQGWADIEFIVLDRKGYRAKWLEKKLTGDDVDRINREISDAVDKLRGE